MYKILASDHPLTAAVRCSARLGTLAAEIFILRGMDSSVSEATHLRCPAVCSDDVRHAVRRGNLIAQSQCRRPRGQGDKVASVFAQYDKFSPGPGPLLIADTLPADKRNQLAAGTPRQANTAQQKIV